MSRPSVPAPGFHTTNGGHSGASDDEADVPSYADGYSPEVARVLLEGLAAKVEVTKDAMERVESAIEYLHSGLQALQASHAELDKKIDKILALLEGQ